MDQLPSIILGDNQKLRRLIASAGLNRVDYGENETSEELLHFLKDQISDKRFMLGSLIIQYEVSSAKWTSRHRFVVEVVSHEPDFRSPFVITYVVNLRRHGVACTKKGFLFGFSMVSRVRFLNEPPKPKVVNPARTSTNWNRPWKRR